MGEELSDICRGHGLHLRHMPLSCGIELRSELFYLRVRFSGFVQHRRGLRQHQQVRQILVAAFLRQRCVEAAK